MAERNVAVWNHSASEPKTREETRPRHSYLTPAVDIHETEEALVLVADLPGLPREAIDIYVEKGVLTIEGRIAEEENGQKLFGEFSPGPYYRQFRIPDTVEPQKAVAGFRNGVLTLTLPRAEKARPRRIEIAAA